MCNHTYPCVTTPTLRLLALFFFRALFCSLSSSSDNVNCSTEEIHLNNKPPASYYPSPPYPSPSPPLSTHPLQTCWPAAVRCQIWWLDSAQSGCSTLFARTEGKKHLLLCVYVCMCVWAYMYVYLCMCASKSKHVLVFGTCMLCKGGCVWHVPVRLYPSEPLPVIRTDSASLPLVRTTAVSRKTREVMEEGPGMRKLWGAWG